MEPEEYQNMYLMEETHWWYVGMRGISLSLLDRYCPRRGGLQVLDAGCGTGSMMGHLAPYGQVAGVDLAEEAIRFCLGRGPQRLCRASVSCIPFADATFDLVTSFDVIYHLGVPDDLGALREFHRVLKEGGILLLRVPAYDFLRGKHDRAVHTRRRYTAGELRRKLASAGFSVEKVSYANAVLFPVAALSRALERLRPWERNGVSDVKPTPPLLNAALTKVLSLEGSLLRWIDFPFGLSVVCLARKL